MWVLFVIALIKGQPVIDYAPMKDQATCEASKAAVTKKVLELDSTAQLSLTCFKPNPVGKVA